MGPLSCILLVLPLLFTVVPGNAKEDWIYPASNPLIEIPDLSIKPIRLTCIATGLSSLDSSKLALRWTLPNLAAQQNRATETLTYKLEPDYPDTPDSFNHVVAKSVLTIQDFDASSDQGNYSCVGYYADQPNNRPTKRYITINKSTDGKLTAVPDSPDRWFEGGPLTVQKGRTARMGFGFQALADAVVIWRKNGAPLNFNDRVKMNWKQSENLFVLEIRNVTADDAAVYSAQHLGSPSIGPNSFETIGTQNQTLVVRDLPEPKTPQLKINLAPGTNRVKAGSSFTLVCTMTVKSGTSRAMDAASVEWRFPSSEMYLRTTEVRKYIKDLNSPGAEKLQSSVTIAKFDPSTDVGTYQCVGHEGRAEDVPGVSATLSAVIDPSSGTIRRSS